jgi:MoxR-like ATPase
MEVAEVSRKAQSVIERVETVIFGKRASIELAVAALLCRGHLLIEDVPGTGKTMLARALAKSLHCTFKRIQFTPDLLPADITGTSIYNQKTIEFEFRAGPVFANVVLADEINRATPKTQSALLECMEEFQVSVDGVTRPLPEPFFVVATQNNIEAQGTFPLPEAQLDRFVMRIGMGYPGAQDEAAILDSQRAGHPIDEVEPVLSGEDVLAMQRAVRTVFVHGSVRDYIIAVAAATREHSALRVGASTRAALDLMHASQALAALRDRDYVLPDDVKALAESVIGHRLLFRPEARTRQITPTSVISEVLGAVPVPVGPAGAR